MAVGGRNSPVTGGLDQLTLMILQRAFAMVTGESCRLDEEAFAPIPHGRLNGRHARSDNNASGRHVLDEL